MRKTTENCLSANNSSLQTFVFNETDKIEVIIINGEPNFVVKDVCSILGLTNVTEAIRAIDEDEKLTSEILRAGQKRKVNLINENGLYTLIMRSSKPEARQFRKWITSEVLPSIRKTG